MDTSLPFRSTADWKVGDTADWKVCATSEHRFMPPCVRELERGIPKNKREGAVFSFDRQQLF